MEEVQHLEIQLRALSLALRERDLDTARHSLRTSALARALGEECGLDRHQLALLELAARVHDLGKIGVPDRVLLKPGPLDADEWALMKQHSESGGRVVQRLSGDHVDTVGLIVRHHHEAFDGSGYPDGLAGENIPLLARIVALADSYDAMAVARPYRRPKTHPEIMAILHSESGSHFDPHLLGKFSALLKTSPLNAHPDYG